MRRRPPTTATDKQKVLMKLELSTKDIGVLHDCGTNKALEIKKHVLKILDSQGKKLMYRDRIPTGLYVDVMMIDEERINRLAEKERVSDEPVSTSN